MSASGYDETNAERGRDEAEEESESEPLAEGPEMGELFGGDVDLDNPAGEQLGDTGGRADDELAEERPEGDAGSA